MDRANIMPDKPIILTRRSVANGRLFHIEEADLEFSNGERRTYEYLKGGGVAAVIIVALKDEQTVLLVEEYGIGLEGYELGLPKGRVDAGEDHRQAANRELKEEVGFGARDIQLLKCLSLSPSYMQHQTQLVLARDLYPESLPGDEPEPLIVHELPLAEMGDWIARGDITEARTIAGLYLAKEFLAKESGAN